MTWPVIYFLWVAWRWYIEYLKGDFTGSTI